MRLNLAQVFLFLVVGLSACSADRPDRESDFYLSVFTCLDLYEVCSCALSKEEQLEQGIEMRTYSDFAHYLSEAHNELSMGEKKVSYDDLITTFKWEKIQDEDLPGDDICAPEIDDYLRVGPPTSDYIKKRLRAKELGVKKRRQAQKELDQVSPTLERGVYLVNRKHETISVPLTGRQDSAGRIVLKYDDLPERQKELITNPDEKYYAACVRVQESDVQHISRKDFLGVLTNGFKGTPYFATDDPEITKLHWGYNDYCVFSYGLGWRVSNGDEHYIHAGDRVESGDILIISDGSGNSYDDKKIGVVIVD